ncbi:tetratricopeptide repeat protein [Fulvivirga ligni]|uniref:tetratricopeptide repeat protein n=1 Tax=Fulvivirga ligni TaxID=2904246 RepID=UPI001F182487|nr:tetratricopeptide repeat protein [Fulvivirga ligni]UII20906.1 tetratricopeptide repeat protein [Fulvivirga ligni]
MKVRIIGLLLCLVYQTNTLAQSSMDSLQQELAKAAPKSSQKVDLLNHIGYEYWIIDSKKSIEYAEKSLELAKKLEYLEGRAFAHRVLGVAYWTIGQPRVALENLYAATDEYEVLKDEEGMANAILNTGMVYAEIHDYEKALELYNQVITIFSKLNLTGRVATTYTKLGTLLLEQGYYYDAEKYLQNALDIHTKNNFAYGISEAHNRLGKLYINQGKLELADHHLRISIQKGREANDEDGLISNLILFGKLLRLRGEDEMSDGHLKLALGRADKKALSHYKLEALIELKNLKKQQGFYDSALYYYDSYINLKDSLFNSTKVKQVAAIEFKNELTEQDLELEYLKESDELNNMIKWVLIGGIWIISLLAFFLVKSLKVRSKREKELLKSENDLAMIKLENEKLKQSELSSELHDKNKELTSYALNFVQKNEIFEELQDKLKEIKAAKPQEQEKLLKQMEKILQQNRSVDSEWEDFKVHFEQVHDDFFKSLKSKYPDLSGNDLKVAALCRLNLSIKESSRILGISPESTKTARYRLRKKLDINQEDDLFEFLSSIS